MTTVVLSLTVLTLAATLSLAVLDARRVRRELAELRAGGFEQLVGTRVTATVVDGGSIIGVLVAVHRDAIVIAEPEYAGAERPTPLGARVTIDRSRVPVLQQFEA